MGARLRKEDRPQVARADMFLIQLPKIEGAIRPRRKISNWCKLINLGAALKKSMMQISPEDPTKILMRNMLRIKSSVSTTSPNLTNTSTCSRKRTEQKECPSQRVSLDSSGW